MAPAHFMGEDGYGSFASLDADLLRLPNNSGKSFFEDLQKYGVPPGSSQPGQFWLWVSSKLCTLLADRHKGLEAAVLEKLPEVDFTNCREHLKRNASG